MALFLSPHSACLDMPSAVAGVNTAQSWYIGDIKFEGDYVIDCPDKTVVISGNFTGDAAVTINARYFALLGGKLSTAGKVSITATKEIFLLNGSLESTANDVSITTTDSVFFHVGTEIKGGRRFEANVDRIHQNSITKQSDIDLIRQSGLDIKLVDGNLIIDSMPSFRPPTDEAGSFEDCFLKRAAQD